jgi:Permuted papain-like amidase enzyme, YaeF/YiiX, C92 family
MRTITLASLTGILLAGLTACSTPQNLREGDLVFQTSRSRQSSAVQAATKSPFSHCGLIFRKQGTLQVLEAVQPVQYTPLQEWRDRGVGATWVAYRLTSRSKGLMATEATSLRKAAEAFLGKDYDLAFDWSDREMYCSELIWKAYSTGLQINLCPTRKFRDFDLTDPTVAKLIRERYGNHLPLDMAVVAPSDLLSSNQLKQLSHPR